MEITKFSVFLTLLFAFFSCKEINRQQAEKPLNILTEEQFIAVLTDFALAESASNLNIKNAQLQKSDSIYAFNPLIENNIRKTQYDSTIDYYSKNTEDYKKIYENVIARLSEMQAKRNAIKVDSSQM